MKRRLAIIIIITMLLSLALPLAYAWQIERPWHDQIINGLVENKNTDAAAAVGLTINVDHYYEPPNDEGNDFIGMNITMTTNSKEGIEYDVRT
jgi:hypothetical protein